jgi:ABC-type multidrug transport system fused ATPase/permease subunit
VLSLTPDHVDPAEPVTLPPPGAELADARTGLRVRSGLLTAVVSDRPEEAAELADRLGLCAPEVDDQVTLGGVPLSAMRRADIRSRIVVSDTGAALFSGRLGAVLATPGGAGQVDAALATAATDDIFEALPEGLDSVVAERGRTFSGGQRQRLVLARALAKDPEILVLVEPTSAVDAHTEARIASRLRAHRAGRTTVVVTSSPLVLDAVDEVAFLSGGRVVATGTHAQLLDQVRAYRALVTREPEPAGAVT